MIVRIDGKDQMLSQWDKGQRLILHGVAENTRIDYAFSGEEQSIPEYAYSENGAVYCNIPDVLLMRSGMLCAYIYVNEDGRGETVKRHRFAVRAVPKPSDYVEPEDLEKWSDLAQRIGDLAALKTEAKSDLVVAINEIVDAGASTLLVQADWNQDDETASDYVKNRTHWIGTDFVELYNDAITFIESSDDPFGTGDTAYISNTSINITTHTSVGSLPSAIYITIDGVRYECPMGNYVSSTDGALSSYKVAVGDSEYLAVTAGYRGYNALIVVCTSGLINSQYLIEVNVNAYYPLDERFIPNTIARVSDINKSLPYIPQEVQDGTYKSNWSVGSPNEAGYIFNRTHYDEYVSNTVIFEPYILPSSYLVGQGYNYIVLGTISEPVAEGVISINGVRYYCKINSDSKIVYFNNYNIGVLCYANSNSEYEIRLAGDVRNVFGATVGLYKYELIKTYPLAERFIPDSIARVSDIPETSDWNQNDNTQSDYIKNRTHWAEYGEPVYTSTTNINGYSDSLGMYYSADYSSDTSIASIQEGWLMIDNHLHYFITGKPFSVQNNANGVFVMLTIRFVEVSSGNVLVKIYIDNPRAYNISGKPISIYLPDTVTIHLLDEAYIPASIARVSDIPNDIGGGIAVTGATVGQTVRIAAVDDNGVPTAWEPVDMAGGGCGDFRLIRSITIPDDVSTDTSGVEWVLDTTSEGESCVRSIYFDTDDDGNPFELKEVIIYEQSAVAVKNYYRWGDQNSQDNYGYGKDYDGNLIAQAISSTDTVGYNFHIIVSANMSFGQMDRQDNYGYNHSGTSEIRLREEGPITGLRRNGYGGTGFKPGSKFMIYGR